MRLFAAAIVVMMGALGGQERVLATPLLTSAIRPLLTVAGDDFDDARYLTPR